ncbi:hypothetical protein NDU88_001865 [Pleurodeles waltl]|uniref:CCHC-type domain-containing protein n=1 Tax=Pleurodeles waltl TaxID=8319 RepID=A0AAV7QBB6_PLEWA|nr:hypothetical protein NDU88_001865 [Pleurodeles waltl]
MDGQHFSPAREKAILLSALGNEGQRIFKYLPPVFGPNGQLMDDIYKEAVKRLENRFAKEVNLVMARYKFCTQPQHEHESIDDFVARLRELTVKCRFGNMTEELIRDQLIVQCKDRKIQKRLWATKDSTLMEAIGMAKVIEELQLCMKELNRKGKKAYECLSRNKGDQGSRLQRNQRDCARCDSTFHGSDSVKCFAGNKICRRCGRKGHYARVCKEPGNGNKYSRVGVVADTDSEYYDRVLVVHNDTNFLRRSNQGPRDRMFRPSAVFNVCGKRVELMVDSGSMYTIIPEHIFKRHWMGVKLLPKDINPGGYKGESIEILGYMEEDIQYAYRSVKGKFYVSTDGPAILGWMHLFDLDILIHPRARNQVLVVEDLTLDDVLEGARNVFDKKLGCLRCYVHRVRVKPNARTAYVDTEPLFRSKNSVMEAQSSTQKASSVKKAEPGKRQYRSRPLL